MTADPTDELPAGVAAWRPRNPSIPPSIDAGMRLDDNYRLISQIGRGAMGEVFLGVDERLDRKVAIKFVRPDLLRAGDMKAKFQAEARAMARVEDIHVVRVYASGWSSGVPYYVMEYVPGQDLDGFMRRSGEKTFLAVDEAVGILDQACRGVAAIHAAGVLHRDLKPTNVLIGPAFRVCVTDLGLSRLLRDRDPDEAVGATVSGTPAYMAPEIVTGEPIPSALDHRADVYSLGVLAFELFTGELPLLGEDAVETMIAQVEREPPTPSALRGDLPEPFDEVILAALAKDPFERTPDPTTFREQLVEARERAVTASEPFRVVVADDDPDFRRLAEETLRYAFPRADIVAVPDGAAALRVLEERAAAMALIDLDMPGMNGVELTAAIRATPHLERMSIVVATATGGAPDWRLLSALGADGFLVKPIDPVALVTLARRTIAAR